MPVAPLTEADDESAIWPVFMRILVLKQWYIESYQIVLHIFLQKARMSQM
jgi:hypothetical protein